MESVQPPAGSQVSRVPAQRTPPDPGTPPAAPPAAPSPPRRRGPLVALVIGLVAVLAVGGTAAGYLLYDRATAPDRSAPDVVVDNYLRAFLVDRDDTRSGFFTCDDSESGLAPLAALRDDLELRESRFETTLSVSWGSLREARDGGQAEVEVDLTISAYVDGVTQSDRQAWRFSTRLDDSWAVCSASRMV